MKQKKELIFIKTFLLTLFSIVLAYVLNVGFKFCAKDTFFILTLVFLLIGLVPSSSNNTSSASLSILSNEDLEQNNLDNLELKSKDNTESERTLQFTPTRISFLITSLINLILSII